MNRRAFIKTSIAGPALMALPLRSGPLAAMPPGSARNALRIPHELSGDSLRIAPERYRFGPGLESNVYGVNGSYLGPTIRLNAGDRLKLTMKNDLPDEDMIIHWHGIEAPDHMDGHPRFAVAPGEEYDYDFEVQARAGTYWYHSHTHEITGPQVYRGVAGLIIVHDEFEAELDLPSGEFDLPLILQDKRFQESGELDYNLSRPEIMVGWQGDTMLVNGVADAEHSVKRTRYRLRLLNASNARVFNIGFSDDRPFELITSDGGLLEEPQSLTSLYLAPSVRAEILVDFSDDDIGSVVKLETKEFESESHPYTRQGDLADLIHFLVNSDGPTAKPIPEQLVPMESYREEDAVNTRSFLFGMAQMHHAINNEAYEMNRVGFEVPLEQLEIWEFVNPSQFIHPIHTHSTQFQVLDRNGGTDVRPDDIGWKDTVLLLPYERVRVLVRFERYSGIYLLHCHNLEHEDDGMMMNFRIGPPSSVQSSSTESAELSVRLSKPQNALTATSDGGFGGEQAAITDMRGNVIHTHEIPAGSRSIAVDIHNLPSGTYWLRVGSRTARFVIAR